MNLWQKRPNHPNFGLIVGLSCVVLLILFVLAWFLLHTDHHVVPGKFNKAPTSQLVLPQALDTVAG